MLHNSADITVFRIPDPSNDSIDAVPELPKSRQRWTARRKAGIIAAVRGGWVPIEEICEAYNVSADEFLAWELDIDRYGVLGLRSTPYQIYRDTEKGRRR